MSRDNLLAAIAETLLIERALPELLDADAHAATIVISRIGETADAGGTSIVTSTLSQPAWSDEGVFSDASGEVKPWRWPLPDSARDVVLVLRGMFVRAALASEHGTWMIRASAAEPDVIRVEVRSGASRPAAEVLRAHLAARIELERVLEHGGALPPNPDVLLPVTRTLTYRPPLRPGDSFGVELEDFSTGWVDRGVARNLVVAIQRAWYLAWSRGAAR